MLNRLFAYAIIINVVLLLGFVLVDYATWNNVAVNLDPFVRGVLTPNGNFTDQITGIQSYYEIVLVGITVRVVLPYVLMPPQYSSITSVNLPFIWFVITIIVNLSLMWYFGIGKMKETKKELTTKPISAQQQKTN